MKSLKMILLTIVISIFCIVNYTLYKVYERHIKLMVLVTEKRITESAMNCYFDDVCVENKVTLKELVRLNYSKEEVNPKTKIYYSLDSYVLKNENTYTFVEVK